MNERADKLDSVRAVVDLPRTRLGHFPTPLEEAPQLSDELGVRLLIKREDLSGLGCGGNKVRKLEFILGQPRGRRADVLLTTGGAQSNHARETAAAAARLGKRTKLYLNGPVPTGVTGNRLLQELFGAETTFLPDKSYQEIEQLMEEECARLEAEGVGALAIPVGGATSCGVAAWAQGMLEIAQQIDASLSLDAVAVATGTGSTATGLALGAAILGASIPIHGISVSRSQEELESEAARLLEDTCRALSVDDTTAGRARDMLRFTDEDIGPGYTVATEAGQRELLALARTQGLTADLSYTAKAFAGLRRLIDSGEIARDSVVLYIHTGGYAELFSRPVEDVFTSIDAMAGKS